MVDWRVEVLGIIAAFALIGGVCAWLIGRIK